MSKFSIKDRIMSFNHAFNGFKVLLKSEHNAWIHTSLSTIAIALGFYFEISNAEWVAVVLCIGMVISAEIFNTAIEHIANFVQPNQDERIKHIKDLGAAAVFMSALSAFIVGLIIYLPKIIVLF
ncbi:MAG: diacylglycerol kinase (ATP) [Saprospiraceae bacterium]|jgi:diacylglycerol kinase